MTTNIQKIFMERTDWPDHARRLRALKKLKERMRKAALLACEYF